MNKKHEPAKPTLASRIAESVKHAKEHAAEKRAEDKRVAHVAHPAKPAAPSKPQDPMDNPRALEKARAYLRLTELDAAPSVTFTPVEQALYEKIKAESLANGEKSRYAEIVKNRRILGLGADPDHVLEHETQEARDARTRAQQQKEDAKFAPVGSKTPGVQAPVGRTAPLTTNSPGLSR